MLDTASSTRTESGRFAPGCSGNPAGRPKGARNRVTLCDEALQERDAVARARQIHDVPAAPAGEGECGRAGKTARREGPAPPPPSAGERGGGEAPPTFRPGDRGVGG